MLVALGAHSDRLMQPSRTWETPSRVEWSVVATKPYKCSNRRSNFGKTIIGLVEACCACNA